MSWLWSAAVFEDENTGRELVLRGCRFVVLCLCIDPQLPKLRVEFFHELHYPRSYRAEVVVVQFLPLRRTRTEQRTPRITQILSLQGRFSVKEKILLFCTHSGNYPGCIVVSEKSEDAERRATHQFHRAQKRRLFVEHLAPV